VKSVSSNRCCGIYPKEIKEKELGYFIFWLKVMQLLFMKFSDKLPVSAIAFTTKELGVFLFLKTKSNS